MGYFANKVNNVRNAAQVKIGEVMGSGADVEGAAFTAANIAASGPRNSVVAAAATGYAALVGKIQSSHANRVAARREAEEQQAQSR